MMHGAYSVKLFREILGDYYEDTKTNILSGKMLTFLLSQQMVTITTNEYQ